MNWCRVRVFHLLPPNVCAALAEAEPGHGDCINCKKKKKNGMQCCFPSLLMNGNRHGRIAVINDWKHEFRMQTKLDNRKHRNWFVLEFLHHAAKIINVQ